MNKHYLLDCTLRDGGYINDWEFGHDNIVNIFDRVVSSGVDFIEIGFLDERRTFDLNRSIMPDTLSVKKIFGKLNRKNTFVVGMIDYGTCALSNLQTCNDSFLDGIRVIFKKDKMYQAMDFCKQVKALGYKVFSQLVSITTYTDTDLTEVVSLANEVQPYALSIVDTYGLLHPEELHHIACLIDEKLDRNIVLGFHAHNNFQLGYTNATTILGMFNDRDVLVDGTLYGMGKSAGNAPIELIAMYMNEHFSKNYIITELQEAITTSILDFQRRSPWGYQLFYYIAASNRVHPNYVQYLMNKRTLSITAVNEILQRIPDNQKLEKNRKLIEQLYIEYQTDQWDDCNDIKILSAILSCSEILVIGPRNCIGAYRDIIADCIKRKKPIIISINYIPQYYHPDYLFITNTTRYLQLVTKLKETENEDIQLIASSNIARTSKEFDFMINYATAIDETARFPDNSMCMLIRTLIKCGCKKVMLAGLDGYTPDNVNYFDVTKSYRYLEDKANSMNNYVRKFFQEVADRIQVTFITPSEYQKGQNSC